MTEPCTFCSVLSGELESSVVAEDGHALAFMHIRPISAGHVLVVPRRHAAELGDLTEGEAVNVFRLVCGPCPPQTSTRAETFLLYRTRSSINARAIRKILLQRFLTHPKCQNRFEDMEKPVEAAPELCLYVEYR